MNSGEFPSGIIKDSQEKVLDDINLTMRVRTDGGNHRFHRLRKNDACFHDTPARADEGKRAGGWCGREGLFPEKPEKQRQHGASEKCAFFRDNRRKPDVGDGDASEEEVIKASGAAQAAAFLQTFPDGWRIWDRGGVNVSGGQKQRLCIAKTLPEKATDTHSGRQHQRHWIPYGSQNPESFTGTLKETTKLIIAQRITSVMEADQIVVMDEGKFAGLGKTSGSACRLQRLPEIYSRWKGRWVRHEGE